MPCNCSQKFSSETGGERQPTRWPIKLDGGVTVTTCKGDLKFVLDKSFLVHGHASVVLLVVAALGRLQVEPRVRERLDVRQQRLDERMKFILATDSHTHRPHPTRRSTLQFAIMKTRVYKAQYSTVQNFKRKRQCSLSHSCQKAIVNVNYREF